MCVTRRRPLLSPPPPPPKKAIKTYLSLLLPHSPSHLNHLNAVQLSRHPFSLFLFPFFPHGGGVTPAKEFLFFGTREEPPFRFVCSCTTHTHSAEIRTVVSPSPLSPLFPGGAKMPVSMPVTERGKRGGGRKECKFATIIAGLSKNRGRGAFFFSSFLWKKGKIDTLPKRVGEAQKREEKRRRFEATCQVTPPPPHKRMLSRHAWFSSAHTQHTLSRTKKREKNWVWG